jgi:hypothetical protein
MTASSFRPTALERAFELARSGLFRTASEVARAVQKESYGLDGAAQITGTTVRRQISALCRASAAGPREPVRTESGADGSAETGVSSAAPATS